jgi:25S rRNA (adenine2142-N1)-methyltransferase
MGVGSNRAPKSLASGRPPTARKPQSISRKATRSLINDHHTLQKKRAQAAALGDRDGEMAASAEISALGGLNAYQKASLQGQRKDRGGDTSKILLDWLKPKVSETLPARGGNVRMLEVGALSTRNACSASGMFDMERIDLQSQEPGIQEQDFMKRPLPTDGSQQFDVISLSLVLNFVPTPAGRGAMLRHARAFLASVASTPGSSSDAAFPAVFIVLPRPCLSNSRYCSQERLDELMGSLGFTRTESKFTQRLAYSLWRLEGGVTEPQQPFAKKEVRKGANRNNFAITLGILDR